MSGGYCYQVFEVWGGGLTKIKKEKGRGGQRPVEMSLEDSGGGRRGGGRREVYIAGMGMPRLSRFGRQEMIGLAISYAGGGVNERGFWAGVTIGWRAGRGSSSERWGRLRIY